MYAWIKGEVQHWRCESGLPHAEWRRVVDEEQLPQLGGCRLPTAASGHQRYVQFSPIKKEDIVKEYNVGSTPPPLLSARKGMRLPLHRKEGKERDRVWWWLERVTKRCCLFGQIILYKGREREARILRQMSSFLLQFVRIRITGRGSPPPFLYV